MMVKLKLSSRSINHLLPLPPTPRIISIINTECKLWKKIVYNDLFIYLIKSLFTLVFSLSHTRSHPFSLTFYPYHPPITFIEMTRAKKWEFHSYKTTTIYRVYVIIMVAKKKTPKPPTPCCKKRNEINQIDVKV